MVTAAKTASQIGLHMSVSFALMYAVTGSIAFGGLAAILEPICNVILMPLHDRFWDKVREKVEARQVETRQMQVAGSASVQPA